jgi:FolB domain-containing protein
MDQIIIKDLLARGIIGVNEDERRRPQDILINIILFVDTKKVGETDDINDTVSYSMVARQVLDFVEHKKRYTVEALAADIVKLCLEYHLVQGVRVCVEKPSVVRFSKSVGVEIERFK